MKKNSLFIAIIALAILAIYFIGQTITLKKELKLTEQCLVENEQKLTVSEIKLNEIEEKLEETKHHLKAAECELHNIKIDLNGLTEEYCAISDSLHKELKKTRKPLIFEKDPDIIEYTGTLVRNILNRYDIPEPATSEILELLFDNLSFFDKNYVFDDKYWE